MARIRVLEAIAGDDFSWSPGDVVDVSEDEALAWADGHRAVRADEGAVSEPVEFAPVVTTADGVELVVVDAAVVEVADAGVDAGSPLPVRWEVIVDLPVAGAPAVAEPEVTEVFDPSSHKVDEVLAHLATVDEAEALRVLDAEAAVKKPRASIVNARDEVLTAARERAERAAEQAAEKAADTSRGGGRADEYETRTE